MPGRLRKTLLACAIAATLAGCGGDEGTIPSDESDQLLTQLDAIQNDIETGNCELAHDHAVQLANQVSELSGDVDPKVRQGLAEASTRVVELSGDPSQCEQTTGATGAQSATTDETTPDEETTTTTTEEETTTTTEPEESQGQAEGNEGDQGGENPLDVPGENGGSGSGGRGTTESGGIEPEKKVEP